MDYNQSSPDSSKDTSSLSNESKPKEASAISYPTSSNESEPKEASAISYPTSSNHSIQSIRSDHYEYFEDLPSGLKSKSPLFIFFLVFIEVFRLGDCLHLADG